MGNPFGESLWGIPMLDPYMGNPIGDQYKESLYGDHCRGSLQWIPIWGSLQGNRIEHQRAPIRDSSKEIIIVIPCMGILTRNPYNASLYEDPSSGCVQGILIINPYAGPLYGVPLGNPPIWGIPIWGSLQGILRRYLYRESLCVILIGDPHRESI